MRTARCIALTTGLVAFALSSPALAAPTTITDTTAAGATADGAIGAGEYAGSSTGVGAGFGGVIGSGITFHVDSDAAGNLFVGLKEPSGACAIEPNHVIVLYVDSVPGGLVSTPSMLVGNRTSDLHRAAIAGHGTGSGSAPLTFATGFAADFAVAINGSFAGAWETSATADPDDLAFVGSLTRTPSTNGTADCQREYTGLTMGDLGLVPGASFKYVVTLLDATSAYRSNEFHGVVTGNGTADAGLNIGANAFSLAAGDFNTFASYGAVDLEVAISADTVTPAEGGEVMISVLVANNADADATNVELTVALPAGLTFDSADSVDYDEVTGVWSIPNVAGAGGPLELLIIATADPSTAGTPLTVTAAVTEVDQIDSVATNDSDSVVITPTAPPTVDLALALVADPTAPLEGGLVAFEATLSNASATTAATAITVSLPLPAGLTFDSSDLGYNSTTGQWTVASLAASGSATMNILASVDAGTAGTPIAVIATLSAVTPADSNATNNSATATVTPAVPAEVDVALAISADDATPAEGADVLLTLRATNTSLTDAVTDLVIAAPLPSGLTFGIADPDAEYDEVTGEWTLPSLAANSFAELEILATVATSTAGTPLTVTASRTSADQTDPVAGNNTASVVLTPELPAGASIVVTVLDDLVNAAGNCSLREAIQAAHTNATVDACVAGTTGLDAITFSPSLFNGTPKTLAVASTLSIGSSMSITGPGADELALSGSGLRTVLNVTGGALVGLTDLAIVDGVTSGSSAGGLYVTGGAQLTLDGLRFEGNSAHVGGAVRISNAGASVQVRRTTFHANLAPGWDNASGPGGEGAGAAIYLESGALTVDACTFTGNVATGGDGTTGGGGPATGGALHHAGATLVRVTNSTFAGNGAVGGNGDSGASGAASGGALYGGASRLVCDHCTFVANTATAGALPAPGIASGSAVAGATLRSSIVVGSGPAALCTVSLSSGQNLFTSASAAAACHGGVANPADVIAADPRLNDLADNGGPTATVAPRSDSAALGAGACTDSLGATLATDQRGQVRPYAVTCDIGAYEGPGVDPPDDYGDAPAPYPTLLSADGARHTVGGLTLGALVDTDEDGLATAHADGDDLDGLADDDGVTLPAVLNAGSTIELELVVTGIAGFANAWIDFNRNGSWADPGEQVLVDEAVDEGVHTFELAVPTAAVAGLSVARVRLNSVGGLGFVGAAADGEVEDHEVKLIKCGDGVVEAPEICDDGDTDNANGCTNDCTTVNAHWECPALGGACDCEDDYYGASCAVYCEVGVSCLATDCKLPSCNAATGACELSNVAAAGATLESLGTGVAGVTNAQFNTPFDVAIDGSGNVYVADRNNHRVQKFDATGAYAATLGSAGTGAGQFQSPYSVAVDRTSGAVYVADFGNDRIQKFSAAGAFLLAFGTTGSGNGQLNRPNGVAVDATGNVYVSDQENDRLQKFTSAGVFVAVIGAGDFQVPTGVAVDAAGAIYATDATANAVRKYSAAGALITTWGTSGSGPGQLSNPVDVEVSAAGYVYVLDNGNHRVQWFTTGGALLGSFGTQGAGAGQLSFPQGLGAGVGASVFVADTLNHRVSRFAAATSCDDVDLCTDASYCVAGTCTGAAPKPLDCDDDNACTTDYCDPATGTCQNDALPNAPASACSDSDACTLSDVCVDGICVSGAPKVCDDSNACTINACNSASGDCEFPDDVPAVRSVTTFSIASQVATAVDVTVHDGGYYLADSDKNIEVYDVNGFHTGVLATLPAAPTGIAALSDGTLYALTATSGYLYGSNGALVRAFGAGGQDLAVAPDGTVVVATGTTLVRYTPDVQGVLATYTGTWTGSATAIAIDPRGALYVAAAGAVFRYSAAGTSQGSWNGSAGATGAFSGLSGLAIDAAGLVYVTESTPKRFQRFSSVGTYIDAWGVSEAPGRAAFDPAGSLVLVRTASGIRLVGVHYVPVTSCDDANSCTGHDLCSGDVCLGGTGAVCGDGAVCGLAGETCDDAGASNGDGCSALCKVEPNASCDSGQPSVCTTACGASCSVPINDSFDAASLGAVWSVLDDPSFNTNDAPDGENGKVTLGNGHVKIQNRGFLITASNYDPTSLGTLEVRSTWKLDAGDQARVHVRAAADQDGNFGEPSTSASCVAGGGSIFLTWPTAPLTPPTTQVPYANGDTIRLTVTDSGSRITCRYENLTRGGTGFLASDYDGTYLSNRIVFTNKNGPVTPSHTALLYDARVEVLPSACATAGCLPSGVCGQTFLADGTACDDDNDGTVGTTCSAGDCGGGCGDGQLDPGEVCDTGSLSPASGCNATCNIVAGWQCFPNGLGGSVCDRETDLELSVTSVTGSPVYAGNNVTVNLRVTNAGPVADSSVVTTIPIPADFTLASASAGCAAVPGNKVACTTATLAVAAQANHSLVFTLDPDYTGAGLPTTTAFTATVDGDRPEIVAQTADNQTSTTVTLQFCGDDAINGPEQCDEGGANADSSAKCRSGAVKTALRCKLPSCGDGITDAGAFNDGTTSLTLTETCDDENTNINDACPSGPQGTCKTATCGDGYVNITVPSGGVRPSEDCDTTGQGTFGGCASCAVQAGWTCDLLRNSTCQRTCGSFFTFATSSFAWTPGPSTVPFAYGASSTFGITGWATGLSSTLPAAPVFTSMWRSIAIPSQADAQRPQLVVSYRLDGTASSDCLKVYLSTKPDLTGVTPIATACTPTVTGNLVVELSGTQAASAQTARVLTVALDATGSAANRKGLLVTSVAIRSDVDADNLYEHQAFGGGTCADPCVDVDTDGWGAATSANRTTGCTAGPKLDCNDANALVKPDINEGAFAGSLACTDSIDNNCDGLTDAADAWCYEDCGNFVNDGRDLVSTPTPALEGDGLTDCQDPNCVGDAFCSEPCLMDWSFTTGGAWSKDATTDTGVFKAPSPSNAGLWTTAGTLDGTRKLARLDLTLPSFGNAATRGPKPTLKVRFTMAGNPVGRDVFAICVDVDNCQINLLNDVYVMRDTSKANTFPVDAGWIVGSVDLTPYLGRPDLELTLLFDTVEASQPTPRDINLTIDRIWVGSDVDGDGDYEGTDPQGRTCDTCWDGDLDGYGSSASPDLRTCAATPASTGCTAHSVNPDCFDCDDTSPNANPGEANEGICGDGRDNDCNGFTDGQDSYCGSEDCANGVDDNGDGIVDCVDVTCAANPACDPCFTGFDFEAGSASAKTSAGFEAYGRDTAGPISLLEWAAVPGVFGGAGGWWTGINANIATKSPTGAVRSWLIKRNVVVGSSLPEPAVELVYDLRSAAGITFGVCIDVPPDAQGLPSSCSTTGDPGRILWSTTVSSPSTGTRAAPVNGTYRHAGFDRAIVPVPRGTHTIVIFFESLQGNNAVPGLFLNEVLVRSDADRDWDGPAAHNGYEAAGPSCDHCVDADGDLFGAPGYDIADLSSCPVPDLADCDDRDADTKPTDLTPAGNGGGEDCYDGVDPCTVPTGLSVKDNDCDGRPDPVDPDCRDCGNCRIEQGETCDPVGEGCSATCQVEAGGAYVTEIHLPTLYAGAGEQWIELYNGSGTTLDLSLLELSLSNAAGDTVSFAEHLQTCVAGTTSLAPGSFYVIAFGPATQGDFTDPGVVTATCPGFTLDAQGDALTLATLDGVLDVVDFRGDAFACLRNNVRRVVGGETKGRSFVLAPEGVETTQLNAQANDVASNWCLAGPNLNLAADPGNPNNRYSNTDNHYGSPGRVGGCAEVACDGIDDDCDGDLTAAALDADESTELIDTDDDGRCDARDCQPTIDTCVADIAPAFHCSSDGDGDGVVDCLDACEDADGDGFGISNGLSGTCGLLSGGAPKLEDLVCDADPTVNPGVSEDNDIACINGVDDDCDAVEDCLDPGCAARQICDAETCDNAEPVGCGDEVVLVANSDDFPMCNVGAPRASAIAGGDVAFRFVAPSTGTVTFVVQNLGTRRHEFFVTPGATACDEAGCSGVSQVANTTCNLGGSLPVNVTAGQTYSVVVKAQGACNVGPLPGLRFKVSCLEICGTDGSDEDADGAADCADSDCVANALCASADRDGDGVSNAMELACSTNPLVPTESPTQDGFLNPDSDSQLNCVDTDDDNDGASDVAEVRDCLDPLSKNNLNHHPLLDVCPGGAATCGAPGQPACGEAGVDANCNGEVDSTEFLCGTLEANCGNNKDDDTDGYTDCRDRDCVPVSLCAQQDFDGDGVVNYVELDCTTDPYLSGSKPTPATEGLDPDLDGIPSCKDTDDDGDGYDDVQEVICASDPRLATSTPPDLDDDFQCDDVDPDDDGDAFADTLELNCASDPRDPASRPNDVTHDVDADGQCNNVDVDDDGDNWNDIAEVQCSTDPLENASNPTALGQDVDDDRLCDVLDDDDDDDGWLDAAEVACGLNPNDASSVPVDTDRDGACDNLDNDDDADNVPDVVELGCNTDPLDATSFPIEEAAQDPDHDGDPNCIDDDDDGDLLSDVNEAKHGSDRLVRDSDGDGIEDGQEDANDDGVVGPTETSPVRKDSDEDGLDDNVEYASAYPSGTGDTSLPTLPYLDDTDADGLLDGFEDANQDGSLSPGETNPVVADTDGDGASDGEEVRCATAPLVAASAPTDKDQDGECDGAQSDTDGDTVPDGVEGFCGTDPLSSSSVPSLADLDDTDDDGVINCVDTDDDDDTFSDDDEAECGTAPRDKDDRPSLDDVRDYDTDGALNCSDADDDADGVSDSDEVTLGTDPQDRDSDDDGLADGRERDLGTDPADADSDDDGVQDGTEVGETAGTADTDLAVFSPDLDPTTVTDPRRVDTDGDGLAEGQEDLDANGRVDDGEGDPLDPRDGLLDTDGDGLIDRDEVNLYGTNPEDKDTDHDALDDKLEVDVWFTDPLVADTDGGGVVDGFEVENGTDPLTAGDDFDDAVVRGDNVFNCSGGQSAGAALGFILMLILGFSWLIRLRRRGGVQ